MKYFAGIDAGSTYVKVVFIDSNNEIIGYKNEKTGINANETTEKMLSVLCAETGIDLSEISYLVSTGYSRRIISSASNTVTEIQAHAAGVKLSCPAGCCIKTVIDIGGQDSKIIILDGSGEVESFIMNDKCAAGTGRFLEALSRTLNIDVEDLGGLSAKAGMPSRINSLCVVFAESEVISLLARGAGLPDIVAGIHESMSKRISNMAKRAGFKSEIMITGGCGMNAGLVQALSEEMMHNIVVPAYPQLNGAFGAAIIAKNQYSLTS